MKFNLLITVATYFWMAGCSSSDVQKEIDAVLDKSPVQTVSDPVEEAKAALERHNAIRASVFSGSALSWSDAIAQDAQGYADTLAASGGFSHDPKNQLNAENGGYANGPYGENIYASTASNATLLEAVNAWNLEAPYYSYKTNSCSANNATVNNLTFSTCGHYTQIVWKKSSYVGCAKSKTAAGGTVIVCKYKTPGNYIGELPY